MRLFQKNPETIAQLQERLQNRGLVFPDPGLAAHQLKVIGYYRLSAYMLPFQRQGTGEDRHQFKTITSFTDIIDLYSFDRQLRLLVMDAIERIEVAVRTVLSDHMSLSYGSLWYTETRCFKPGFELSGSMARIKMELGHDPKDAKRRQIHIRHYYETYGRPELPPNWMVFEALPFGFISRIFASIATKDRKEIAAPFRMDERVVQSTLHALSYLRNLCAHHGRIWNRVFTIKPMIPNRLAALEAPNHLFYGLAILLQDLWGTIVRDAHWAMRLSALLLEHPQVREPDLGFQADWRGAAHWALQPQADKNPSLAH